MFDNITTFIKEFLGKGEDRVILLILVIMITFFFVITVVLFIIAVYLRILNRSRNRWEKKKQSAWVPAILRVMDGSLKPEQAFFMIKERYTLSYLLYLERYIDLLKGKEKERLVALGRLSMKKLQKMLNCPSRKKQTLAMHMLSLLHSEEEFKNMKNHNIKLSFLNLREMRFAKDPFIKKQVFNTLFYFPFVSPVYISNIITDMGTEVLPWLHKIMKSDKYSSSAYLIVIESLRRLHDAIPLEMTNIILKKRNDPVILSAWLRYIEAMGDKSYINNVYEYIDHPHPAVRLSAVRAYIEISDTLTAGEIATFFNDPYVMVPVQAAKKIRSNNILPYIPMDDINDYRWPEIFRRMVF